MYLYFYYYISSTTGTRPGTGITGKVGVAVNIESSRTQRENTGKGTATLTDLGTEETQGIEKRTKMGKIHATTRVIETDIGQ